MSSRRHTIETITATQPSSATSSRSPMRAAADTDAGRPFIWAGDPPWGVTAVTAGHPPVPCQVASRPRRGPDGTRIWDVTPLRPLPPGGAELHARFTAPGDRLHLLAAPGTCPELQARARPPADPPPPADPAPEPPPPADPAPEPPPPAPPERCPACGYLTATAGHRLQCGDT